MKGGNNREPLEAYQSQTEISFIWLKKKKFFIMTCEGVGKGKSLMIDVRDTLLKTKKSGKRPKTPTRNKQKITD